MEAARLTMSGRREELAYPNDMILSVRPPVLLSYEARVDSFVDEGTHFLDTLCATQGKEHAIQTPAHSILPFQRLLNHVGYPFSCMPIGQLGSHEHHQPITGVKRKSGFGAAF